MELKDVILSTLAEMEEEPGTPAHEASHPNDASDALSEGEGEPLDGSFTRGTPTEILEDERRYLESVKERLLVLFEGFQSPNNTHIEAKVDLTLNFLEYLLATIDTRIDKINFDGSAGGKQAVVNHKSQTILLIFCIVVFWLVQSQTQGRASSTAAHDCDTKGRINIVLLHVRLEILCC